MTMMRWWQNTDPPATCSIQGSLTLRLEEAAEENHHPMQAHCQSKSTNLQKCPHGNKNFKSVLDKYASEVIKIYTTNCCQLDNCINRDMYKILQSVIMKTYMAVKTRTWYT